jgi:hypothetical protein
MGILDLYARLGDRGSENYVTRDTREAEEELKKSPRDPDKPVLDIDEQQALQAGGRRALELGIAGASIGSTVNPGVGTAVGALVGGTVGFVSGVIGDRRAQERAFQTVLDEYKIGKEQEKMSEAARREAARLQKSQQSKKDSGMKFALPQTDQIDRDIMAASFPDGSGPTKFDDAMRRQGYIGYGGAV